MLSINGNDSEIKESISQLSGRVDTFEDTLISDNKAEKLNNYIDLYDQFMSTLSGSFNTDNLKSMEILFDDELTDDTISSLYISINGERQLLVYDEDQDEDQDPETLYSFDVPGFIFRIEVYPNNNPDITFTEILDVKTAYNKERKITSVYITKEDYQYIYELKPNNKIKIYYID